MIVSIFRYTCSRHLHIRVTGLNSAGRRRQVQYVVQRQCFRSELVISSYVYSVFQPKSLVAGTFVLSKREPPLLTIVLYRIFGPLVWQWKRKVNEMP